MDSDFIDDFIEEYKNQPCLWQAKSVDFKNRKKRQEAYYKLIEVASRHGEHYNIERTKQKINNLRCAFRHQLKKFTESKNNKSGIEEKYCPKRRYFESLMFLLDEETTTPERAKPVPKVPIEKEIIIEDTTEHMESYTLAVDGGDEASSGIEVVNQPIEDDGKETIELQVSDEITILPKLRTTQPKLPDTILRLAPPSTPTEITIQKQAQPRHRTMSASSSHSTQSTQSESASKKVKIDCSANNFEKLLHLACKNIHCKESSDDDFGIFGKMVAYKLRSMDTQQSMIAEKLITDILLEGQMKLLSYPSSRNLPTYRQDGQTLVISGVSLNGTTQVERPQQYTTQTIQYSTGNGSQL